MEISGAALRRTAAVSGVRALRDSVGAAPVRPRAARVSCRPRGVSRGEGRVAFSDVGHLKYYASPVRCGGGKTKKEEKKRAKLVKGLSRDLAALCTVGIGADDAGKGLAGEVKGKMITEAAELLLAELKQLKAQEKEKKRKRKEQKTAMKAARMKGCANDESSSSSSSESSDSECDNNEVLRMSYLRIPVVEEPKLETPPIPTATVPMFNPPPLNLVPKQECSSTSIAASSSGCCGSSSAAVAEKTPMNRIEVCMGGKCRRSGAMALMEEFNRKIGVEGAVVGCKCMGKCRDGPNVRVSNHSNGGDVPAPAGVPKNPLCLGVSLEDVGNIVANFFGEEEKEKDVVGLMAAA